MPSRSKQLISAYGDGMHNAVLKLNRVWDQNSFFFFTEILQVHDPGVLQSTSLTIPVQFKFLVMTEEIWNVFA